MPARTKILIAVLVLIGLGAGAFVVYDQNIKRQQREIAESLKKSTKPIEEVPEAPKEPTKIESSTKDAAGEMPVTLEALKLMPEYLRAFAEYRMLVFGAVMVLMMIFRPQGLINDMRRKYEYDTAGREDDDGGK